MSFTDNSLLGNDILYYDVVITNLNNIDSKPVDAVFTETRSSPFIACPQAFLLSIARFTIDTTTLPVIIPTIKPFTTDTNETIYKITMTYQAFSYTATLMFLPQDLQAVVPAPPKTSSNGLQDNTGGYYCIYTYQYFIELVNNILLACWNGIIATSGLKDSSGNEINTSEVYPYMCFDPTTKLASLILPKQYFSSNIVTLFFNPALYQLFSSFPIKINSYNSPSGQNVQIIVDNFGASSEIQTGVPSYPALQINQEYSTTSLWTPLTSIVFCSSTLPIVQNQISAPLYFVNGVAYSNNGSNNSAPIITDMAVTDGDYKPNLVYSPYVYRYIDLKGNRPIYSLDISVYWKDRYGNLQPFKLSAGSTITIKLMFIKKSIAYSK
jgi:hypothetical protein